MRPDSRGFPQVTFSFDRLRSTVDDPPASWQLLLRVDAEFSVSFDGRDFYKETEFPVVEFGSQAAEWLRHGDGDFLYVSMESEEKPLLGFYREADGRFRLYSPHQVLATVASVNRDDLRRALSALVGQLASRVQSELGLDIRPVL